MKTALFTLACAMVAPIANAAEHPAPASPPSLTDVITQLDGEVFDAFNRCSEAGQLERHASYFSTSVEFYHDNGGVTWNRDDMIANTRKNVCGNFTRALIPGSVVVHPIKDFGAIEMGSHRFCQTSTGQCDGLADFTIIWQQTDAGWKMTRVLSYGHRAAAGDT